MFLLQGMLQHVSITGYAASCFYCKLCCHMFRPFCAYVGIDTLISQTPLQPLSLKDSSSPRVCITIFLTSLIPRTFKLTQKSFCRQFVTEGQSTSSSPIPSSVKSVLGFRRFLNPITLLNICAARCKAQ